MTSRWLPFVLSAALISACHPSSQGIPGMKATFGLTAAPQALSQPRGEDWYSQRLNSPQLQTERASYFRAEAANQPAAQRHVQAWPTASSGWAPLGTYPGINLSNYGAAGDTVPNAPATTFFGSTVPASITNKIFYLTKGGKFIKVDKYTPTTGSATLALGKTFSKTAVTLSPACRRAYLLADDGTLFVVSTETMTVLTTLSVAGGYGIAPTIDPFRSRADDNAEYLYVPDNAGNVTCFNIQGYPTFSVAATTSYPVATGITPIAGSWNTNNYKVACPAVVVNGVIYLGDEAGNFQVYDTNNAANNVSYALGNAGIQAPPALELQDGSYTGLTDAFGNAVTVGLWQPIYAFVNVCTKNGPMCAWVNLVNQSISDSLPLYCDDNDRGRKADYLLNYNYKVSRTTTYVAAQDGGNVAMDGNNLPGTAPAKPYSNTYLMPAETNLTAPAAPQTWAVGNQPVGVAFDDTSNMWVTNMGPNTVTEISSTGAILRTVAVGSNPMGIAFDTLSSNMWVCNQGSNTVSVVTPTGGVTSYPSGGTQPTGIAIDAAGNAWVANKGNKTLYEISPAGVLTGPFTTNNNPVAVTIDPSGNVWVANNGSNNIQKFSSAGALLGTYATNNQPLALAADSLGNVWVANFGGNTLQKFSPAGAVLKSLAIGQPQGVAIDGADNVWATSKNNNNVQEWDSAGTALNTIATGNQPYGVDVGASGVAVADFGSNQLTLSGAPGGGPVYTYLRFRDPNAAGYAAGSSILSATLYLTTNNTQQSCYVPEIWQAGGFDVNGSTGVYYKGTTTLWQSNGGLTAANAPSMTGNIGTWIGGGVNGQGVCNFGNNKQYKWDVTPGLGGHNPVTNYGLGVRFSAANTKGNTVYFPGGPLAAHPNGNKAPFYNPQFQNNPLNADPSAPNKNNDQRPVLELAIGVATAIPQIPVETAPVIDSTLHKVYSLNVNYLYCMDFSSMTAWTDTAYSPTTNTGTMYTTYNCTYWGATSGATINNKTDFVTNTSTPAIAYDGSSIYCYNYYPKNGAGAGPYTLFDVAVSRITLPLTPGTDRQSPNTGAPGSNVNNTLTNAASNTGQISSPNACRALIDDPFLNSTTTGGGIYFALDGTNMIYQFTP